MRVDFFTFLVGSRAFFGSFFFSFRFLSRRSAFCTHRKDSFQGVILLLRMSGGIGLLYLKTRRNDWYTFFSKYTTFFFTWSHLVPFFSPQQRPRKHARQLYHDFRFCRKYARSKLKRQDPRGRQKCLIAWWPMCLELIRLRAGCATCQSPRHVCKKLCRSSQCLQAWAMFS